MCASFAILYNSSEHEATETPGTGGKECDTQVSHDDEQDSLTEREVYMTTHEVAHLLRLSEQGVRYRLRKGILPGFTLGSDRAGWRISRRELEAWIEARRRGGPGGPSAGKDTST